MWRDHEYHPRYLSAYDTDLIDLIFGHMKREVSLQKAEHMHFEISFLLREPN